MFKSSDESLHIELCGDFVVAEVGEADFDLVAELRRFFFGFRDTGFITFGDFDGDGFSVRGNAAGWRRPERAESLD